MAKQKAHGVGKEQSTRAVLIFSRFEMSEIIHNYAYISRLGYIMVLEKKLGDGRSVSFYVREKGFSRKCF